ncbi:LysE family translocator [uncultured Microbulbifer sp.]|uniref:LysE family translocator n=1 Tax=uncultured Microbulbifer sp. TaxID=348147 RepID=UPI002636E6B4|nr:LysE family translocator [uncultured Microbulbifer sp.]
MQFESWLAFCSIALLATATPGPAALLVSVNSLSVGFKKSLVTVLGNISGLFIMSGFSVLGLSVVVLHSAIAFTAVKILGAMYLIYMGFKLWRNGIGKLEGSISQNAKVSIFGLYAQGIFVALTNPKAIVFITALFPQFISGSEPLLPQFTFLVFSFMFLSFICLSTYSLLAQSARFSANRVVSGKVPGRIFGSTFIGAGYFLATASK